MRRFLPVFVAFFVICVRGHAAIVAGGPSHDGEQITCDLLEQKHLKNTGGIGPLGPGSGAGLCVFTSIEHAAHYQNCRELWGFQKWMTSRPGGGYPEKLADMIGRYCQERNMPVPDYIQHTGGDMDFLRLALKTGRMVSVTYAGRDGVYYSGRIAHMVNLVHLSKKWAVILDNNNPGRYLWMSPDEFRERWLDMSGGWAVVLTTAPPSPIPSNPPRGQLSRIYGDPMQGGGGSAGGAWGPLPCPPVGGSIMVSGPLGTMSASLALPRFSWSRSGETWYLFERGQYVGYWTRTDGYTAYRNGRFEPAECPCMCDKCECGPDCKCDAKTAEKPINREQKGVQISPSENYGISLDKLRTDDVDAYRCNGRVCTRRDALTAMGVIDDTKKGYVVACLPSERLADFRKLVDSLPIASRSAVHVQAYESDHWDARRIGLAPGVSIISPPDQDGRGKVIYRFEQLPTTEQLAEAIRKADGAYDPSKDVDPSKPKQMPTPLPDSPKKPLFVMPSIPSWLPLVAVGGLFFWLYRREKNNGKS